MLTEFAAEVSALFEFVLATFNTGVEYLDSYAEIEKKFSCLDLTDENVILEVLIGAQMLLTEVAFWRLDVDLAAKKSQLLKSSAELTVERFLLGTLHLQKVKRVELLYLTQVSLKLMMFQIGKSETDVYSMHSFNENKLKDMRRLWVADKFTEGNIEIIGCAMDSLAGLASEFESGLQTICGLLLGHISQ